MGFGEESKSGIEELGSTFGADVINRFENDDLSCVSDPKVHQIQNDLDLVNHPDDLEKYHDDLKDKKPKYGKEVLNNGDDKVPSFNLLDGMTLGATFLARLAFQGYTDCKQFRDKDEKEVAENCAKNNVDYVSNNWNDDIKEITSGIGIYNDIQKLKRGLQGNDDDIELISKIEDKQFQLDGICANNRTLDVLVNSDKDACALAQGKYHVGVFASKINDKGEKEFFLIDQGGRKAPGSSFPDEQTLFGSGIKVMNVKSTNGMCMATSNACLKKISKEGLDNFLDKHASEVIYNGKDETPELELIDILTLGITYLIKLAQQGAKDNQRFKNEEPMIANNCEKNNIDYVKDNEKDGIKDVTKGIGLYHDISDIKKQIAKEGNNPELTKSLEAKQKELKQMCSENRTLDTLINSDKQSCAIARGLFHVGVFASKINDKGEKEFFLVDQGGRKMVGSGFPSDDTLAKNGINVVETQASNGMCMATASAGIQKISQCGLDEFVKKYTIAEKESVRDNVKYEKQQNGNNLSLQKPEEQKGKINILSIEGKSTKIGEDNASHQDRINNDGTTKSQSDEKKIFIKNVNSVNGSTFKQNNVNVSNTKKQELNI